ncbi:ABC transporter permease subunit [Agrobacterium rubi]|nr:ABC transporter permease subunit [Agrobacterium rubi]NTF22860.1 ABC transporter permease subunit [Agrobacterium rubi]NTF29791.1 ABC transporter permease subunit [Agrobacterium rubi]
MDLSWLSAYGALLIAGLGTTLSLLALSAIFGFTLAVPVALMRLSSRRLISIPAAFYTSVIRGTPLLVQIYIFYYGLGSLFTMFPSIRASFLWPYLREGYWYVVIALILSVAAYVGEILRGGLLSVPRGEIEAARAFGMTHWQVLIRVRLPRAIGFLLPTLAGETVMLLKSTALASTVAVVDLLGAANLVRSQTFQIYPPLLLVATIYLGLTLVIETCFAQLKSDSVFNFHRHARKKP